MYRGASSSLTEIVITGTKHEALVIAKDEQIHFVRVVAPRRIQIAALQHAVVAETGNMNEGLVGISLSKNGMHLCR